MRRREFIAGIAGGATAWQVVRAEQSGPSRRIAVLTPFAENNSETKAMVLAFSKGLEELGWSEGRNLLTQFRWGGR